MRVEGAGEFASEDLDASWAHPLPLVLWPGPFLPPESVGTIHQRELGGSASGRAVSALRGRLVKMSTPLRGWGPAAVLTEWVPGQRPQEGGWD